MKRAFLLMLLTATTLGCRKDREPNKIIDGLPLKVTEVVLPAYALQQLTLFKRDNIRSIITTINKTSIANPDFSDLTNISSNTYRFSLTEARYGTAQVTIRFYDGTGAGIDPIITRSSTSTIKSVSINTSGTSGLFTYSESGSITLDTAGNINSTMRSTGTFTFTGSDHVLNFSIGNPARTTIDGFRDGFLSATGSRLSNGDPVTMAIGLNSDQSANGTLTWDGQQGSIHIGTNGTGFIITSQARIPIE